MFMNLHLLHNAVRGALIFYILKLSTTILRLKVSFLNVSLIVPFTITLSTRRLRVIFIVDCASTTTLKLMMLVSFSYVHEKASIDFMLHSLLLTMILCQQLP